MKPTNMDEAKTPDEITTVLLRRVQVAIETIEQLETDLETLRDKVSRDPLLSDAGMDEVFLTRELPGILRALNDLPPEVRDDPCRRCELDLLMTVLRKVDAVVR